MVKKKIMTALTVGTILCTASAPALGDSSNCSVKIDELPEVGQIFLRLINNELPLIKIKLPERAKEINFPQLEAFYTKDLPIDKNYASVVWKDIMINVSRAPHVVFRGVGEGLLSSAEEMIDYAEDNTRRNNFPRIFIKDLSEPADLGSSSKVVYETDECKIFSFGNDQKFSLIKSTPLYLEECINIGLLLYYGIKNVDELRRMSYSVDENHYVSYKKITYFYGFIRRLYGARDLEPVPVTDDYCELIESLQEYKE